MELRAFGQWAGAAVGTHSMGSLGARVKPETGAAEHTNSRWCAAVDEAGSAIAHEARNDDQRRDRLLPWAWTMIREHGKPPEESAGHAPNKPQ
ncbi:hypothetical protein ON010_g19040 [Phytophthora cinnamomi]|nr:hypothetical protein ON010_g19040 [Phytophthora cinnamomi]